MTPQTTFLIIAPIRSGRIDELRELLRSMNDLPGHADPDNQLVPFGCLTKLHVARFVILEAKTADELKEYGLPPNPWQTSLAFLGDIDGDRESFFNELNRIATTGLQKIFAHCEGFEPGKSDIASWLSDNNIEEKANYINWLGRTVQQVKEEAALHENLARFVDDNIDQIGLENTTDLRQKILTHVELERTQATSL